MSGIIRPTDGPSEAASVATRVALIGSTDGIGAALAVETIIVQGAAPPRPVAIQGMAVTGFSTAGTISGILAIGPGPLSVTADTTRTRTAAGVVALNDEGHQSLSWMPLGDTAIKSRMSRYSFLASLISDSLTGFEATLLHAG